MSDKTNKTETPLTYEQMFPECLGKPKDNMDKSIQEITKNLYKVD